MAPTHRGCALVSVTKHHHRQFLSADHLHHGLIGGVLLSALFRLIVAPGSAWLLPERSNYDRIGVADGNRYLRFCIWQASTNRRTSTKRISTRSQFPWREKTRSSQPRRDGLW